LLGIRLAPGPHLFPHFVNAPKVGASSCSVQISDGGATIEVRAPSASHVELSGDFTRWTPVTLERGKGDRWTVTTRLSPGIHRFVVRIDGGSWLPAPGLPQTVDSYEGTVSVIVAP
jgi:1,4-alpha-glucan branching enzyme